MKQELKTYTSIKAFTGHKNCGGEITERRLRKHPLEYVDVCDKCGQRGPIRLESKHQRQRDIDTQCRLDKEREADFVREKLFQ